ncbi:MAG: phage tail protein [Rhizobiales bacterium]|nr:phage tail protein [Hyphomicrobiales bacterium]
MVERHSIVTVVGRNKHIAKIAVNQAVIFTEIALGDGTRFPSGGETTMENELYRAAITGSGVEPGEPDAVWFDLYVPANVPTIQVQEIGLFDEDGVLYALSRFDQPVPKFGPDSTALSDQTFRIVVVFSDTENILVTLSPVAGITPETLPQYLPFATDPEFDDPTTIGRIAEVAQIYKHFTQNSVLQNNLVYPEIETASAKLAITDNADGTLTIDPAQTWLWRGVFRFSSDDILLADRTVMTVASKTYHLRWHAPGTGTAIPEATYPNGRLELADLTGANPAETDATYDSTYDRMLIAFVTTDGAGALTIRPLKNKARLVSRQGRSAPLLIGVDLSALLTEYYALEWARAPIVSNSGWAENVTASATDGAETQGSVIGISRYGYSVGVSTVGASDGGNYAYPYQHNTVG